jgi:hypothetical protein
MKSRIIASFLAVILCGCNNSADHELDAIRSLSDRIAINLLDEGPTDVGREGEFRNALDVKLPAY